MNKRNCETVDEILLLAYFITELASVALNAKQAVFSLLKAQISLEFDIDMTKNIKLRTVLKRKSEEYDPKTSKFLEKSQIVKFLNETDNKKYLTAYAANINGTFSACRRQEITELTMA